nr:serine protease snake-like [Aedes albopictus]
MTFRIGFYFALLAVLVQGQRIADIKCEEYRNLTIRTTGILPLVARPNPIKVASFTCTKTVKLIVGGEVAKKNEFPHQALLGWIERNPRRNVFSCGGSLISRRYVLTAAHCFKVRDADFVRLGEHDVNENSGNHKDFDIASITRHPDYRFSSSYHDIALIKLNENVRFSKVIRPACLWTKHDINVNAVIATGYGMMETGGNHSTVLRKVVLKFLDRDICGMQFSGRSFRSGLIDEQLCIGSDTSARDTCQGDSGGPIQTLLGGCTYHIIAVTSLGPGSCGLAPALYTRVSSYVDWIESIVWEYE